MERIEIYRLLIADLPIADFELRIYRLRISDFGLRILKTSVVSRPWSIVLIPPSDSASANNRPPKRATDFTQSENPQICNPRSVDPQSEICNPQPPSPSRVLRLFFVARSQFRAPDTTW